MEYVSHMEESLASARSQLETFSQRCRQLVEEQQTMADSACQVRGMLAHLFFTAFCLFLSLCTIWFYVFGVCFIAN